jgi:UDP-glucose 4-epimerase
VSINELAESVLKVSGKSLKILHETTRAGDIVRSVADISKARLMLKYAPKFPLEKGLKSLLELQSGKHK